MLDSAVEDQEKKMTPLEPIFGQSANWGAEMARH